MLQSVVVGKKWPNEAFRGCLAEVVESPARDTTVVSERQRVTITCGDRDEVAVDAGGRCLSVAVPSPARNIAVALQRQRVSATRGDGDVVALHAVRRRLAEVVVSPARNVAVASKCQRMRIARGDGDEVALYAVRWRLTVVVPAPARDVAVMSQSERETMTCSKVRVGSRNSFEKLVAFLDNCDPPRPVHYDKPFTPDGDGVVSQPMPMRDAACFHES